MKKFLEIGEGNSGALFSEEKIFQNVYPQNLFARLELYVGTCIRMQTIADFAQVIRKDFVVVVCWYHCSFINLVDLIESALRSFDRSVHLGEIIGVLFERISARLSRPSFQFVKFVD